MDPTETVPDYERFEREQIAQDRDRQRPDTVEIDEPRGREVVTSLLNEGVVEPIPEQNVFQHVPSGQCFDSDMALVYFHKGWEAATEE
ncbi:hypothetical protein JZX76_00270 [Haloarcula hispanica]|uniref:DUF8069 domain-containing protein n=1 Tax=Haloarcula hispanica TaxID=51589 RepID=A0A482TD54_HALHI|nr:MULTISPECIES: hypothetical protein [Haloarcula]MCJ0618019.1 hypothetical protein [Haloarcula hispanica]MUV50722.1 hypothetical protein [Haloarcula sp. CBA1122]RYJ15540.1 hypothetical protein ELS20_00270 [Haloarcula hispanica]